jgi:hypothetical protein
MPVKPSTAAKFYMDFMAFTQKLVNHIIHDFADKRGVPLEGAVDIMLKEYRDEVELRIVETTMLKLMDEHLYIEYTHPERKRY